MAQTDATLLSLYQDALAAISYGRSYTINGRTLTRENLRDVRETIDWLERRIARSSSKTGGAGVVSFGDAV